MDQQLEVALKGAEFKRLMDNQFFELKKKYGLKKVEIEVLFYLSISSSENTPTDIFHHLKINRGHISQAIVALIKKDYICAVRDKADRRSMHYIITDKAKETIEDIIRIRSDLEERLFKNVTQEEINIFQGIMRKISDNIEEMLV